MRISFSILASLMLVNCIPIPHKQQESPELFGVLLDNDKPVADATVLLVVNPADTMVGCPDTAKSVKTDANGKFKFARVTYHQSVYPFASTRTDQGRICFKRTDRIQTGGQTT